MSEESKILSPTEIMRGLCNQRRNSDIRADDKELRELMESAFDSLRRERDTANERANTQSGRANKNHDAALGFQDRALRAEAELAAANETLGRTVSVVIGTSCLTRDLVWCGGCARGLSRTGNWYHCPQCGGKIDQESYIQACNEATKNGLDISRYVSGERADLIKTLEVELAAAIEAGKALQWQPIETAPQNGEFLALWPAMKLDDDGDLTDTPAGHPSFRGVAYSTNGAIEGPDSLNATGEFFGDDWEYGPPTHWMPLPADPVATPEPSGNSGELMKPLNIVEENPRGLSDAAVRACLDNDHCPYCADGELDTGYECNKCGADCLPIRERLS